MKCLVHNQEDAVSTCKVCGCGLCAECTKRFKSPMCENCLLAHNSSVKKSFIIDFIISAIVFCFAFSFFKNEGTLDSAILFSYFTATIPWGWSLIGRLPIPAFFLSDNATLFYYMIKLMASLLIGSFAFPLVFFLKVREILKINQVKKDIGQGKI